MTDMNVLRSIFARDALRKITQSRFRRCKRRKFRLTPQASRGAGEKQRPATVREEYGNRGLGQLIATECVLAPMLRETLFADLQERRGLIAPGVMNGEVQWSGPIGGGDKAPDIFGVGGIADGNGYVGTGFLQLIRDGFEFGLTAARNGHGMSAARKSTRYRGSQASRCTHAHDEDARLRGIFVMLLHGVTHWMPMLAPALGIGAPAVNCPSAKRERGAPPRSVSTHPHPAIRGWSRAHPGQVLRAPHRPYLPVT